MLPDLPPTGGWEAKSVFVWGSGAIGVGRTASSWRSAVVHGIACRVWEDADEAATVDVRDGTDSEPSGWIPFLANTKAA